MTEPQRDRRSLRTSRSPFHRQTVFRTVYARRAPTASYLGTSLPEGEKTRRRREGRTINFFLCQKEKRLQKRSWQPCRLTAWRPSIVPPQRSKLRWNFSVPEGAVPQMAASPTPEAKRLEAVGSRTGGFDLMGAVRVHLHHANHGTQTVWVCVPRFVEIMSERMQGCADGISPPPLGDLFPPCDGEKTPPVGRRSSHRRRNEFRDCS